MCGGGGLAELLHNSLSNFRKIRGDFVSERPTNSSSFATVHAINIENVN